MINYLAKNQNWAKLAPWMAVVTTFLLFKNFTIDNSMFWSLLNIPLYLYHQTEEHYIPGGFKQYMNRTIFNLPEGVENLTDIKIFWINILLVWVAFTIFGLLCYFVNLGFGLLIIIFSLINCLTHIIQVLKHKEWNPGAVMASIQFVISIYAAYFVTTHGLINPLFWWILTILFSILVHVLLFKLCMAKPENKNISQ